jgi:hypothetical protein
MMRPTHALLTAAAALLVAAFFSCGGDNTTTPSTTTATTTTTTTTTLPSPGSCNPTPPPLYRIRVKIHAVRSSTGWTLDSRPEVLNVNGYCEAHGMGNGDYCFTSKEGAPDAAACDMMAVGMATDTGRWGPTWGYKPDMGSPAQACRDDANPGCVNHDTNQFLVIAKGAGAYQACVNPSIPLAPGMGRCGFCQLKAGATLCN